MSEVNSAPVDSLSPEQLLSKARELSSKTIKIGNEELIASARDLEKSIADYVQKKGRKANVVGAATALLEQLTNPEYKAKLAIEIIIQLLVEIVKYIVTHG